MSDDVGQTQTASAVQPVDTVLMTTTIRTASTVRVCQNCMTRTACVQRVTLVSLNANTGHEEMGDVVATIHGNVLCLHRDVRVG